MKYNQNYKIMQITESTLIIGVDIAKKVHYARAFDWRGIELDKTINFKSRYQGFQDFIGWVNEVSAKYNKDKVIVGLEPTGHYWYTFAQEILAQGYMVVQVNPYHVKKSKELDDNSPSKSDRKDPKTIAMLVKDGRYQIPYMPQGLFAELRKANNLREEWLVKSWSIKNKVHRWLDTYFPEFTDVFKSWEGKAALLTLTEIPLPGMIVKLSSEEIVSMWRTEVKRAVGLKRAQELKETAMYSVGVNEGTGMAYYEMRLLMKEYHEIRTILEDIEARLEELVLTIPGAARLLEVKGIGIKTAAGFLAEIGDINRFNHPKQIIKLAGLNLRENSSGDHKGQTTITKRGRSRLRAILFRAMLPLVAKNAEFKVLHKYYTAGKDNIALVQELTNDSKLQTECYVYMIDKYFDMKEVVSKIIQLVRGVKTQVRLTERNISKIFEYFCLKILRRTQSGKSRYNAREQVELFMLLILDPINCYIHPNKKNTAVFGRKHIAVNGDAFISFTNYYKFSYNAKEKRLFTSIADRLIADSQRRRKGDFYTPTIWHEPLGLMSWADFLHLSFTGTCQ